MRQLCNVAYVAQLEGKLEPGEAEAWDAELHTPPGEAVFRTRRSVVTAQLDSMMRPRRPQEATS